MLIQGQVGQQVLADGAMSNARSGKGGELMVSELNPRYYELAYRGKLFTASNQAARALSLLSSACTGFCLTNPVGSPVNLVLIDICVSLATAPAGVANLALAANQGFSGTAVTQTTPETVISTVLSSTALGTGLVGRAVTLPATPTVIRGIGGGPVATGSVNAPFIRDEVAGEVIVSPGTNISLSAFTTAISTISSMVWAETPL